ncbi:hypothetical protein IQ24_00618 [Paracoccus sulfuroxidans]|uniref:Uncharacterized protein n=2 Tax=Paracoccus sulfuroxidans TaxID=384678 RepID=A0A562NXA7_9RHOB|nr:hypothetical protein IQ24_00618 [Paracoccus sulfuroxidans]
MQLIADAFGRARRAFPENPGEVIPDAYYYSVTCLATLLTATAMLVAFLTILPAFSSIRVKRMWLSALLALPMGGVAMLYVFSSSWFSDKTT